jgi:hypothetical protein
MSHVPWQVYGAIVLVVLTVVIVLIDNRRPPR